MLKIEESLNFLEISKGNIIMIAKIEEVYKEIKPEIEKRLCEFKKLYREKDDVEILFELLFCLLTPQSRAKVCWRCIERLKQCDIKRQNRAGEILPHLEGVRFKYKKSKYIEEAIKKFLVNGKIKIKDTLEKIGSPFNMRTYLVKEIKGLGMKEASHFLRNIGKGDELAILDRHILKNLKKCGVIKDIPKSMTVKKYISIEHDMKRFAEKINIPMDHLDLVFWYMETGKVFK